MSNGKSYFENGNEYHLGNIWQYMEKDYWDADDLKFDFWYGLIRHQGIFNEVMEINGLIESNYTGNDCTEKLKKQIMEKNKGLEHMMVKLEWDE